MTDFFSSYSHGFVRIAAATLPVAMADPPTNAERVADIVATLADERVALAVFPELCLTGYAIDDLLLQDALHDAVDTAVTDLLRSTSKLATAFIVGAPIRCGNRLFNCALVCHAGKLLGVAPKSYLPNYREFYEKRHFALGDSAEFESVTVAGQTAPFGTRLLFAADDINDFVFHTEICEDLWVPTPPSSCAALHGATVLTNISGSPINIGKSLERHQLCQTQSARCLAAYVYAAAGEGESSTDLAWDGQTMIYEAGELLAASERFPVEARWSIADVDLDRIRQDRMRQGSFDDNRGFEDFTVFKFTSGINTGGAGLRRVVDRFPFVPDDASRLAQDCYEGYNIQVSALEQRLRAIGSPKIVIGVSGGLDSSHALLVAAKAMDRLGRPREDVLAFTMPGFATTDRTRNNAEQLSRTLGVTFETLDIRPAAEQMLRDMGHPAGNGEPVYDVTFENVQAGLRYDYLFRLANQRGGIVLGTGDLSELALGWCTYGVGDQMSHYSVNAGVPKTLIQHLIRWVISNDEFEPEVAEVLTSILETEITPELIPTREGETPQSTEASIGPYSLQDFNLYYFLRHGFRPDKIAFLAYHAWADASSGSWPDQISSDDRRAYTLAEIKKWLQVFCSRFFGFAQFKRSALPNGPKVVAGGSLSPRGDWRAPSDSSATIWLQQLDEVPDSP